MVPLETFMAQLIAQKGDRYVWAAEASPLDPNPSRFDCSELIEWAAARAGVTPRVPDGSSNQWDHVRRHGQVLSVAAGIVTRGAFLWRPGHCAIALGDKTTIEARGRKYGVGTWSAADRFSGAGLLPGIDYTTPHYAGGAPGGHAVVLRRDPHHTLAAVRELQVKLQTVSGKPPGRPDGIFGDQTLRAVVDFQRFMGLADDGVVGPKTWGALDYAYAIKTHR